MADDDCDDCGLWTKPTAPPDGPRLRLTSAEYDLYAAGQRTGHADALANEAENMERLARWLAEDGRHPVAAAAMLVQHAVRARDHARTARADAAALVDRVEASRRGWWAVLVARLRAAWQAFRLGVPPGPV